MSSTQVFDMVFAKLYPLYLNKIVRKGRQQQELDDVICWLTGYNESTLVQAMLDEVTVQEFFDNAPMLNPCASQITGSVCGVKVQGIADPLMQKVRWMDKLVDELAKGRPMEKILRGSETPAE